MLKERIQKFKNPKDEFKFVTSYYSKFKDKYFTSFHDRILLYYTLNYGYGNWEDIRKYYR
jgi:hypothetical protein